MNFAQMDGGGTAVAYWGNMSATQFRHVGSIIAEGPIWARMGTFQQFGLDARNNPGDVGTSVRLQGENNIALDWNITAQSLIMLHPNGNFMFRSDAGPGDFTVRGNLYRAGSGVPVATQAAISETGLTEILELTPRRFQREYESNEWTVTDLVVEELEQHIPDAVKSLRDPPGFANRSDNRKVVNDVPVICALINAVKALHTRVEVVEARR